MRLRNFLFRIIHSDVSRFHVINKLHRSSIKCTTSTCTLICRMVNSHLPCYFCYFENVHLCPSIFIMTCALINSQHDGRRCRHSDGTQQDAEAHSVSTCEIVCAVCHIQERSVCFILLFFCKYDCCCCCCQFALRLHNFVHLNAEKALQLLLNRRLTTTTMMMSVGMCIGKYICYVCMDKIFITTH